MSRIALQHDTMNPFAWSFRICFLVGFLACAALLGFALYAEHVLGMTPCPLCVFQRIGFMVMAVFFLLGALHGPRGKGRWIYLGGALLGAAFGIVVAGRHLWIQSLPPDLVPSCGPNLGYMMDTFPLATVLKLVFTGSGECAKVQPILGLPMPAWALAWFVILAVWGLSAARRKA